MGRAQLLGAIHKIERRANFRSMLSSAVPQSIRTMEPGSCVAVTGMAG
jgi:hypothetical protein